jgi:peptidoglycan hydrolase-like protein with peptidoglycan-binding domain
VSPSLRPPSGSRRTLAMGAGAVLVVVVLAAVGIGAALSGSGGDTETSDRQPAATESPTTTDPPTTTTGRPTTTTAPATTTTAPPTTTTTAPPDPAADGTLELGEGGPAVLALQQRLVDLGYWLGSADGNYGQLTRQAVMAFQKAEGLGRDGVAGPVTQGRLAAAGRQGSRAGGTGLEIDLERQVLMVVQGGQVQWVINTSTGNNETYTSSTGGSARAVTPPGSYTINRQIDGVREAPLGTLYRPKYFNGGIAIHGSGSIPAHPASHGCARVTNSAMDMLWSSGVAAMGTPVTVY